MSWHFGYNNLRQGNVLVIPNGQSDTNVMCGFQIMCKRCKKDKGIAKGYIICFDCLIELDINHKNYKKWKND
jgi:hypothetical protein